MQPKVSIIVPVYKTEKNLRNCLNSLVNQILTDIEIICVNDASPGNALEIIEEYTSTDSRVKLINFPQNCGVSTARNAGMKIASGEYLGFVDSDDTVEVDFYSSLYEKACKTNADIVKGVMRVFTPDGTQKVFGNEKIKENKFHFLAFYTTAIYQKNFLQKFEIDFPNGITRGQDLVFSNKAVLCAKSLAFVDDAFYNYAPSGKGLTMTIQVLQTYIKALLLIVDELNQHNLTSENYLIIFTTQFTLMSNAAELLGKDYYEEGYPIVAKSLFELYKKCKYKQDFITKQPSVLHSFFLNNDLAGLEGYFQMHKTPAQKILANLRYKVRLPKVMS